MIYPANSISIYLAQKTRVGIFSLLLAFAILSMGLPVKADTLGTFQRVETETLDEEDFVFPDDLKGKSLNIVMLAMSKEQDNGTWQGDALVEWYAALAEQGVLSDQVLGYHFSVMKVPFFIKGIIRGGMAKSYKDKMPLNQAGAIFIKDLDGFAAAPGLKVDDQPTIVLVAPSGELLAVFKGEATPENVDAVAEAVAAYLQRGATGVGVALPE